MFWHWKSEQTFKLGNKAKQQSNHRRWMFSLDWQSFFTFYSPTEDSVNQFLSLQNRDWSNHSNRRIPWNFMRIEPNIHSSWIWNFNEVNWSALRQSRHEEPFKARADYNTGCKTLKNLYVERKVSTAWNCNANMWSSFYRVVMMTFGDISEFGHVTFIKFAFFASVESFQIEEMLIESFKVIATSRT